MFTNSLKIFTLYQDSKKFKTVIVDETIPHLILQY